MSDSLPYFHPPKITEKVRGGGAEAHNAKKLPSVFSTVEPLHVAFSLPSVVYAKSSRSRCPRSRLVPYPSRDRYWGQSNNQRRLLPSPNHRWITDTDGYIFSAFPKQCPMRTRVQGMRNIISMMADLHVPDACSCFLLLRSPSLIGSARDGIR